VEEGWRKGGGRFGREFPGWFPQYEKRVSCVYSIYIYIFFRRRKKEKR
jgi:hypothetical protein